VALALGGYVFEMSQGGRSSGIGKVSFFRRLPAQASLWHVVNEKGPPVLNLDGAQVGREIYNVATLNKERFVPPYTGGFYMLMKYTSVQTRIVHIIQNSGLIMVLYPYLLDQYGWIAILIFNVVFALYNLFAITQLRDAISRRSVPMVFASGTLIFFQVGTIWGGDLNMMAGPVALACVAVLVFAKLRISALAESARAMKSVAETSARSG
jgi:hypothetical protein